MMGTELPPRPAGAEPRPEAPPAEVAVVFIDPRDGETAAIFACKGHLMATINKVFELDAFPALHPADPAQHGCKGCQESWPRA